MGCAGEDPLTQQSDDGFHSTSNGLEAINGLSTRNGFAMRNGLSTRNGLTMRNGFALANGLATANGISLANGFALSNGLSMSNGLSLSNGMNAVDPNTTLPIDCGATGTPGQDCWGQPDGLMNARTGLMSSDDGITTATYLVRCALAPGDVLGIQDYTGEVQRLHGEVGLTPNWKTGECDRVCQEKNTACLLALTNGSGQHIQIELSAHYKNADGISGTGDDNVLTIGTGHSSAFKKQEASFYGNIFTDPPQAYYCTQNGPLSFIPGVGNLFTVDVRACGGYVDVIGLGVRLFDECPIKSMGSCNEIVMSFSSFLFPHPKCSEKNGAKTKCDSGAGTGPLGSVLSVFNNKTWHYPMTTWVQ